MELQQMMNYELMYIIVDYGQGSKILKHAKKTGIPGGTIFFGRGTIHDSLLNFFSVYEKKKEIVLIGTSSVVAEKVLIELNKKFGFHKQNHGIAFTTPIGNILEDMDDKDKTKTWKKSDKGNQEKKSMDNVSTSRESVLQESVLQESVRQESEEKAMYQLITTIVDRGRAEEVVAAANAAGAKGGTIMNARGSGTGETARVFNMEIEPEKEMVLILAKCEITPQIVSGIREALEIDKPGKGIIFTQEVGKTFGVYE